MHRLLVSSRGGGINISRGRKVPLILQSHTRGSHAFALEYMKEEFRRWGYQQAALDPLNKNHTSATTDLSKERFGTLCDTDEGKSLYDQLQRAYCGKLTLESGYVSSTDERQWLQSQMESTTSTTVTPSEKRNGYIKMEMAQVFETFLSKKFASFKRYSGEGAEAMLPALETIFQAAASSDIDEIVIGMPHRGRLATLVSLLDYPAHKLFWKIQGNSEIPQDFGDSSILDDVTSHIGTTVLKSYHNDTSVKVSLLHNPSHLEIINPVATGKVRAKIEDGSNAMCLLLHGDAAFSGQGCVPEGLALSQLPDYNTNGSIHIVVNNQIGFTTTYEHGRSSRHCSDIAKAIEAPVLHVNGESLEDVITACKVAFEYRSRFQKDILINLVTYRRHGHNEVDEPSFTNPSMYETIRSSTSFPTLYSQELVSSGVMSTEKVDALRQKLTSHMESEFKKCQSGYRPTTVDAFENKWEGMSVPTASELFANDESTGADSVATLLSIGKASVALPEGFKIHDRLRRTHVDARLKQLDSGKVDWATAEAMAFGSLLKEGHSVRLAGQDCKRGTFSQRHAALTDQVTEERYSPLAHMEGEALGRFNVINSNLSELAVMAFEYGFSWESPRNLVIWEAQFGDFNNGAQIVIDQFIGSSESKWLRQSGLVLLLPHGYDGAGPDHSSSKIERFLQMVDTQALLPTKKGENLENFMQHNINMSIVNPTTPANYFHLLRRQQHRNFRKPLIVVAPKTLLRAAEAQSTLEEMGPGTSFLPVLDDSSIESKKDRKSVKRVLLCSGKFYYDIEKQRSGDKETVVIRLEQLAPFPFKELEDILKQYSGAKSFTWVQEEPLNQGAWTYVKPHLEKVIDTKIEYVGRPALAASAVGLLKEHKKQDEDIKKALF